MKDYTELYYLPLVLNHEVSTTDYGKYFKTDFGEVEGFALKFKCVQGFINKVKEIYIDENNRFTVLDINYHISKSNQKEVVASEYSFRYRPYLKTSHIEGQYIYSVTWSLYEDLQGNNQLFMHGFIYDGETMKLEAQMTYDESFLLMVKQTDGSSPSISFEIFQKNNEQFLKDFMFSNLGNYQNLKVLLK
ncbi:hypothetical protein [Lactococcus cremoris]|uniref:hypothetical protein n=1 Tax=Lactococcus lactis subsp. cremoris TaxID=1359 RepID=UPI00300E119F